VDYLLWPVTIPSPSLRLLEIRAVEMNLTHWKLRTVVRYTIYFLFFINSLTSLIYICIILDLFFFFFFLGCPLITLSPNTFDVATVGDSFNATLIAGGGAPPYTITNTTGSLPSGLSLTGATSDTIFLSGVPMIAETATFTITATDDGDDCATLTTFSLFVSKFYVNSFRFLCLTKNYHFKKLVRALR
jgi:hypothetical protein